MERKSNTLLKVAGILMIIGGGLSIILGIVAVLGVGLLAALGVNSGLLTLASIIVLISGVVMLIAGILGAKNAAKPEKAQSCIIFGIIVIVLAILGNVLSIAAGTEMNYLSLGTGLILPILYLVGAFQSKKSAG